MLCMYKTLTADANKQYLPVYNIAVCKWCFPTQRKHHGKISCYSASTVDTERPALVLLLCFSAFFFPVDMRTNSIANCINCAEQLQFRKKTFCIFPADTRVPVRSWSNATAAAGRLKLRHLQNESSENGAIGLVSNLIRRTVTRPIVTRPSNARNSQRNALIQSRSLFHMCMKSRARSRACFPTPVSIQSPQLLRRGRAEMIGWKTRLDSAELFIAVSRWDN